MLISIYYYLDLKKSNVAKRHDSGLRVCHTVKDLT